METINFQPLLKQIRWGGRRLGEILNKPLGDATDYAESWEIADHGDDQTIVADGPYAGWTLQRLVKEKNEELFGPQTGREQFPLLIKFLDANDRLSAQVHPNDELAKEFDPSENGKTEAWVIMAAEPGSVLYSGLKAGVTESDLREALAATELERCLHTIEVQAGDCVFVPAGTVHAIGEGILLAEIQQMSDLTFRLYDWGRVGADGKPRQLHIEESVRCTDFSRGPVDLVTPQVIKEGPHHVEELVRSPYFVIRRHVIHEEVELESPDICHVLMTIAGAGELTDADQTRSLSAGNTVLVPATCSPLKCVPNGSITLLEAYCP
ncbi:type I phosphomannose isomerase catalytic subunit [Calycomorphotria hydatis]|nr:type I phosphomannose isomerase catalytic subunit [Calycomorphotria hydatis]